MKCASFTVPHEEGAFGDFGVSKGESGFEGDIESAFSRATRRLASNAS